MNQYITEVPNTDIEPKYNTMTNCYKLKTDKKTVYALKNFAEYVNETEVSIKINTEWNCIDLLQITIQAETEYLYAIGRVEKILRTIEKIAEITEEEN